MKHLFFLLSLFVPLFANAATLCSWEFSRDSVQWERVRVPHDWAISGPFDKKWDLQTVAIEQNGEKTKTEKSGRSGSLPWIGRGYYRTVVDIAPATRHAELLFDGAMAEPRVYVGGRYAGGWAYGYNAFAVDITPYVHAGRNEVVVSLQNVEESSRWYPGAGLYRPVELIEKGSAHLVSMETYCLTEALGDTARLSVGTVVAGADSKADGVMFALYDKKGMRVAAAHYDIPADGVVRGALAVRHPQLWSPEHPTLYRFTATLYRGGTALDTETHRVGLRTVSVGRDGFRLNGVARKIKGVCLHHDLGPLGAAVNEAALARQLLTMKAMGCDAIRTSHNMPSTMQMELCDSLGLMVMAESFDMWEYPKCKNGYARFFRQWAERDITNLVKRHRNHAAIVMWSIGNEIPEQGMKGGKETAERLQALCHRLDPMRPVTQGCDRVDNALATGFMQAMDVPGLNYRLHRYQAALDKVPQGFILGSETASTVSSRGTYKFPVQEKMMATYKDGQCTGYDTEWCSWSNLPDDDWRWQEDCPQVVGEFVWTGYDYLGEPTPYDEYWPSRSSYFGICDLAGLPKDRYWLYRSHWNTSEHTTHLLPHWTWPARRGQTTPVYCYTDGQSAELFLNGKSLGRREKQTDRGSWKMKAAGWGGYVDSPVRLDRYRLRWNDVRYEPGELVCVAYDKAGRETGRDTVRTAGAPAAIRLTADRTALRADGNDMAFVRVCLVDKAGTVCPTATDQMTFAVSGAGTYQAACNGDATSLEPFTQPTMRLFAGELVVLVRAAEQAGDITLTVSCPKRGLTQTAVIKAVRQLH